MARASALDDDEHREWLLRGKWLGFYDGSYAPHGGTDLPWQSHQASTPLVEYLARERPSRAGAAIELGCGSGENLVCLASAFRQAVGVDISPVATRMAAAALKAASLSARILAADVLALPEEFAEAFDFVFDCQTFQCVRKVDEAAAAAAIVSLMKPNAILLLITGNADEEAERGPERLTRAGKVPALALLHLQCRYSRLAFCRSGRRLRVTRPGL